MIEGREKNGRTRYKIVERGIKKEKRENNGEEGRNMEEQ